MERFLSRLKIYIGVPRCCLPLPGSSFPFDFYDLFSDDLLRVNHPNHPLPFCVLIGSLFSFSTPLNFSLAV
jgi:hypothetical protein